jgi:hypothetical protein
VAPASRPANSSSPRSRRRADWRASPKRPSPPTVPSARRSNTSSPAASTRSPFQSGGKVVLTYKFGKASGPCGILHAKSRLFPGHASANAKYKVQFDDSKKLSKKASLKIVTGLGSTF